MSTFLFDTIIFGPVWSRRLGESLGINLLPAGHKVCNFNCIYCECGLTPHTDQHHIFPSVAEVKELLDQKLAEMQKSGEYLNTITFAGNGEPTLHPQFPQIIEEAIESRNRIVPEAKIAVLSNATLIGREKIFDALIKVDLNILKLDSAIENTLKLINCPGGNYNLPSIIETLKKFKSTMIIQTLFLKGSCNGKTVDNTTEEEVSAWSSVIETIRPETVMIYSLARDTAINGLEKVSEVKLNTIAARIEKLGILTQVTP
jgi:wyosine [tRNA(Phe)-imidazoG37] synthetase (radical SAM superfamily)